MSQMSVHGSFDASRLRARLLQEHPSPGPAAVNLSGVVLFVDMAGYTKLAENLLSQGPDGVERLGRILDRMLSSHVDLIDEWGGEVACFAGDAVLAYWLGDGPDSSAIDHALTCAERLHTRVAELGAELALAGPGLHIGVGAGRIWAARLGFDEAGYLLLAGPAVREACAQATVTAAGHTSVAPSAMEWQDTTTTTHPVWPGDDARETGRHAHVPATFPRRVRDYTHAGYAEWIPQRRAIAALFVRIDGLDESAPDAVSRFATVVDAVQRTVRVYSSSLGTLLVDDKGLVLTVCFGMPYDTHTDDPVRAIRAALAVQRELARLGLTSAAGVAAGDGVCMATGAASRRQYWPVGRFMHLAGRLMEGAGTGLLCTEDVAVAVRHLAALSPEPPLPVKGVPWPLATYRVTEGRTATMPDDTLFGRENEQAVLDECLESFRQGRGRVLRVVGDAGLGKSALVQYLLHGAARRGIPVVTGGAISGDAGYAYDAWRTIFSSVLAPREDHHLPSEVPRGLRLPQLAPLLNAVVPGFAEETPASRLLTGQARADATSQVLSEVLVGQLSPRFVVVLEDCHWMDSASWRLVLRLSQDYPHALLVLTSRPVDDTDEIDALRRLPHFQDLHLAPLRPDAISALVSLVLGPLQAAPALTDEIAQRSAGNPLFAREYALLLASDARRRLTPVPAATGPGSGEFVPVTVQALIASRLDSLTPEEDLLLKTASVAGNEFDAAIVASASPNDSPVGDVTRMLDRLAGRELLRRTSDRHDGFAFRHALIRDVTYGQLTAPQRRSMHHRVATAIEAAHPNNLRPFFAALAHHWSRAGDVERTIACADAAAAEALAAGAFAEGARLIQECLQYVPQASTATPATVVRWYRQLADARSGLGELESRAAAAQQALRCAGVPRPRTATPLLALSTWRLVQVAMAGRGPLARLRRHQGDALDIARAYRHSAEVCYFNNDVLGMIHDSASAVTFAASLAPSSVLAGASTELGGILSVAGFRRPGERLLRRAIAQAEVTHDDSAQAHAFMVSCLYYVGVGDWQSAERSAQRCQELCERADDRVNWTNAQAVLFWMSHYRSHDAQAVAAAESLRDRASETGNRQHQAWALRFLGLCALRRHDPSTAVSLFQSARDHLSKTAARNERIPTLGLLGNAQMQNGDVWAARATAREGLALLSQVRRPIGHSTLEGYSGLLSVALDAWQAEKDPEWHDKVRHCLRLLGRYQRSFAVGQPRYDLHRGEYAQLSGSTAAARRHFGRGRAKALRLGMPWDATRCERALETLTG